MMLRILCLLSLTLPFALSHADTVVFKAIAVEGLVTVSKPGSIGSEPVKVQQVIPVGSTISTGPKAQVILQQGDSMNIFQIKDDTTVRLDKSEKSEGLSHTAIYLDRGTLMGNVGKLESKSSFQIDSRLATGSVQGTELFCAINTERTVMLVFTKEGAVLWKAKPGVEQLKAIIELVKGQLIPKEMIQQLFDFGEAQRIAKMQAFIFKMGQGELPKVDPVNEMNRFVDFLKKMGDAKSNFDGPPPIKIPGSNPDNNEYNAPQDGAPVITQQPADQTVITGNSFTLTVVAVGAGPLTYQWQKDGVDIPGATGATYTVANAVVGDSGVYRCLITNPHGTTPSNNATVTVNPVPPTP